MIQAPIGAHGFGFFDWGAWKTASVWRADQRDAPRLRGCNRELSANLRCLDMNPLVLVARSSDPGREERWRPRQCSKVRPKRVFGKLGYEIRRNPVDMDRGSEVYRYIGSDGAFDYELYEQVQEEGKKKS